MNKTKRDLLFAALRVAREAPKSKGHYVATAQIQWQIVETIRRALGALGINYEHWDTASEYHKLLEAFDLATLDAGTRLEELNVGTWTWTEEL
ncbi:hypothetical protein [uncultured Meiothermus sp.]|uniref:hypothetical protein n=1 Tax=uncultured Meiothermus sp. TaxID=157471 RepID=UPI00261EB4AF|nr:hypothetical protein [uncultured Meiothermus sp.]